LNPNDQWLAFFGERTHSTPEQHRLLSALKMQHEHLTRAVLDILPASHAKTQSLLAIQNSLMWAEKAVELFHVPKEP
jgi:hypothetical protein